MSFQAYLDNIQVKTGKTPQELIDLAKIKGFDNPKTKAGEIMQWLKDDFDLNRGHAMAVVHIIKNAEKISDKHVNTGKPHSDTSNKLNLTGENK